MNTRERLKEIRKYLNDISQQKLADSLGMKIGAINSIEKETQKEFPLPLALAINETYGIDLIWILYGKGEMIPKKTNTLELRYAPILEQMQTWGKRLQKIQLTNDFTNEQFAKIIDVSLKRFLELCIDSPKPKIEELVNIKENFDVTLDWLLFGNNEARTESINKIEDLGLTADQLLKLKNYLKD